MKKNYILDTNILIHDPESIFKFEDNNIIIPFAVIEELDGLKKAAGEVGYNARRVIRIIGELREKGNITSGIDINNGGSFSVYAAKTGIRWKILCTMRLSLMDGVTIRWIIRYC